MVISTEVCQCRHANALRRAQIDLRICDAIRGLKGAPRRVRVHPEDGALLGLFGQNSVRPRVDLSLSNPLVS